MGIEQQQWVDIIRQLIIGSIHLRREYHTLFWGANLSMGKYNVNIGYIVKHPPCYNDTCQWW